MHAPGWPTGPRKPDLDALRVLMHVWARRLTGVLETRRGELIVVDGEPIGAWGRALAEWSPWLGPVCFREEPRPELGEEPVLAGTLWSAAGLLARPGRLNAAQILHVRPAFERALDLPVSPRTRIFLEDPRGGYALRRLVAETPADRDALLDDLARLVALGLLAVEDPLLRQSEPPPRHPSSAHG